MKTTRRGILKALAAVVAGGAVVKAAVPAKAEAAPEPQGWAALPRHKNSRGFAGFGYFVWASTWHNRDWFVCRGAFDPSGTPQGGADYGPWPSASLAMAAVEDGTFKDNPHR